jgi:CheY-like chemotaxis protein
MLKGAKVNAQVTIATSGREAFNLLHKEQFDLCIMEYALPDMSGVQLCSLMRQMGCDVPMMFFSAMDRPVDKQKAEAAGADEYLCKPDDLDIFVDAVSYLLNKRRHVYIKPLGFAAQTRATA